MREQAHWQSPSPRPDVKGQDMSEHRSRSFIIQGPDGRKKSPQRHTVTLSWPCPNVVIGKGAAWKNSGNPVLYHTLKKKKNISQSKGSTLSGWGSPVGMAAVEQCHPCHHNKSFSLLQRQIHPHDMLGWAEEFPSQSYKYFQWIQWGQWLTKPSKWTQLHWNMPAWFKRAVTTYH